MKLKFLERLRALAKLCSLELDVVLLELYDKTLATAGYEAAMRAVDRIISTRNARDPFPSIADLMKIATGVLDDGDNAQEAAHRILEAVTKMGRYRGDEAREFIGSLGWYVVQRSGGWPSLCTQVTPQNASILRSQWKELALSAIRRNRLGLLEKAPSFEQPQLPAGDRVKNLVESTALKIGGTSEVLKS